MAGKNTDVWYARCRHFIVCSENEDPVPPKTKNEDPFMWASRFMALPMKNS